MYNFINEICQFRKDNPEALIGCAESRTHPQGLNTVQSSNSHLMSINVDGLRATSKYNDVFEDPKEFLHPLYSSEQVEKHIKRSLDLCLYHLNLTDNTDLPISDMINAKNAYNYHPENLPEARERISPYIAFRRGQKKFRDLLLKAYKSSCAITNIKTVDVLEAAHIIPYDGIRTNHIQNGILLRADIHILFDLGLITIDSKSYKIVLSNYLRDSEYSIYQNSTIYLPAKANERPGREALDYHNKYIFAQ